jgi:hypothetical protein
LPALARGNRGAAWSRESWQEFVSRADLYQHIHSIAAELQSYARDLQIITQLNGRSPLLALPDIHGRSLIQINLSDPSQAQIDLVLPDLLMDFWGQVYCQRCAFSEIGTVHSGLHRFVLRLVGAGALLQLLWVPDLGFQLPEAR